MASNILHLTYFIILFSLGTIKAQDTTFLYQICSTNGNFTKAFESNLKTLFSSLSSASNSSNRFYNTTVSKTDTVYGLFMCRGDVPPQLCGNCVVNATQKLSSDSSCSLSKQAMIWYDECMVRYSNVSFFTTVDLITPPVYLRNTANITTKQVSSMSLLLNTMNETADQAANSGNRYATKETNVTEFKSFYSLAQCTRDLSPQACRTCLSRGVESLPRCCEETPQGARILLPSCNLRYELYPFYRLPQLFIGGGKPVPETKYPQKDSKYSENPGYLSHNCSRNQAFITDSAFKLNLMSLFSNMSSNATDGKKFLLTTDDSKTVYGIFLCREDIPLHLCRQCVQNATQKITSQCSSSNEAIIWYNHCLLRYSNKPLSSRVDTIPKYQMLNISKTSIVKWDDAFMLSNALAKMAQKAGDSVERYQKESLKLNDNQTIYMFGQCTGDLSSNDCGGCLSNMIGSVIPWSRLGSIGGRVLYPSCTLRFELFQFYDLQTPIGVVPSPPGFLAPKGGAPSSTTETRKFRSRTIIILIVFSIVGFVILLSFGCYLIRRKVRKTCKAILRENFGQEGTNLESLQFDLSLIKASTNNFSHQNKIGKGGFGEVYKGILVDGRHIAVKRLSTSSSQGVGEFKNEVLLIAKLQHRNLVALIGFCLEEQEKILIYEYVPNKSLDYFLFDTHQRNLLSWFERYKIIGGIARGILYLHEHSRLKVIHRDLKPSNILLDVNMNPKISDFGLARIVEIDQEDENTNRIVGTRGYMSPEYVMFGQFSEKSDVFSFGVMILEIITGKKNFGSYESFHVADGLLSYVWRQWRNQTPLSIVDQNLEEHFSQIEVSRIIQIGLLCVQENPDDRPTMVTIVSFLSSQSIELPSPQQPAFFLDGRMDHNIVTFELNSSQSTNSSKPLSINRMSTSEFLPR